MWRVMLKSKIHRARVTGADLHYEGSLALDADLMKVADIAPGEQIHVYNVTNGARFVTYAIPAPAGSGTVMLNGAAARLGMPGDQVIVAAYAMVEDGEVASFRPRIIMVDERNRVRRTRPR